MAKQNKDYFIIVRVTKVEKDKFVKETNKSGFKKISDYARLKLGI